MVSRDLENEKSIFIQFPPLKEEEIEDNNQSGDEDKAQAGWESFDLQEDHAKERGQSAASAEGERP